MDEYVARAAGFLDLDLLRSIYAGADVVSPVRWQESFGLVPLEAMGVGRPLVTTAQGGTPDYVRDRHNAPVCPADDPHELARCIERLAGDEALRRHICAGGHETAITYSAERSAGLALKEIVRAAVRRSRLSGTQGRRESPFRFARVSARHGLGRDRHVCPCGVPGAGGQDRRGPCALSGPRPSATNRAGGRRNGAPFPVATRPGRRPPSGDGGADRARRSGVTYRGPAGHFAHGDRVP